MTRVRQTDRYFYCTRVAETGISNITWKNNSRANYVDPVVAPCAVGAQQYS